MPQLSHDYDCFLDTASSRRTEYQLLLMKASDYTVAAMPNTLTLQPTSTISTFEYFRLTYRTYYSELEKLVSRFIPLCINSLTAMKKIVLTPGFFWVKIKLF